MPRLPPSRSDSLRSLASAEDITITEGIENQSVYSVAQGGYADLHTATLNGQKIGLKLLRILNAPESAKRVSYSYTSRCNLPF